jgi:hypothetical protein
MYFCQDQIYQFRKLRIWPSPKTRNFIINIEYSSVHFCYMGRVKNLLKLTANLKITRET